MSTPWDRMRGLSPEEQYHAHLLAQMGADTSRPVSNQDLARMNTLTHPEPAPQAQGETYAAEEPEQPKERPPYKGRGSQGGRRFDGEWVRLPNGALKFKTTKVWTE